MVPFDMYPSRENHYTKKTSSGSQASSGFLSHTDLNSSQASTLYSGSSKSKDKKISRIWKWIKYGRRKGILDVGPSHPNFIFILSIRHCFRHKLSSHPPRHHLKVKDYSEVTTFQTSLWTMEELPMTSRRHSLRSSSKIGDSSVLSLQNQDVRIELERSHKRPIEITFKVFAPIVFASLRAALGIRHDDFLESIAPPEEYFRFLQYVTNSKSKYCFFLTYDRRFILKIETLSNIQRFLSFLEDYIDHFIGSPHSLLVKIIGVFGVKVKNHHNWLHFIVMQSIFWPSIRIQEKYDIKGCVLGRVEPKSSRDEDLVLKDGNFEGTPINMGQCQSWFLEQLVRDVDFLKSHGVMDYSLLVGIQRSMDTIRFNSGKRLSMAEVVSSFKRSSVGFSDDASHEIRSASAHKRRKAIHRDSSSAVKVTESGSARSRSPPALTEERSQSRLSASSLLNDLVKEDKAKFEAKACPNFAPNQHQIILKPLKGRKNKKNLKIRQVTFSGAVQESHYTPSPTFQIHQPQGPDHDPSTLDLSAQNYHISQAEVVTPSSFQFHGGAFLNGSAIKSPGISPLVDQIQKELGLNFLEEPNKMPIDEDSFDRIESAPHGSNPDAPVEDSTIYEWQKLDDFTSVENRRLLPDTPNASHIIDGPCNRYYIGIVDIFTPFGLRQRLGGWAKTLILCGTNHSSANPEEYGQRLLEFIEEHVT